MLTRRAPVVIKLGGELLEQPARVRRIARALTDTATRAPLLIVHGGGREVDAEMARLDIPKHAVDGLRITDAATLDVVLGVLAGRVNTRLVAAIVHAGGRAVGLTGADAGLVRVRAARRYRATDGAAIDLGFVGLPVGTGRPTLVGALHRSGHVPVVASIGADRRGRLFNVNADTLAGDLAVRVGARRLIIAGATPGVLDGEGRTIAEIDDRQLADLIREGAASVGMIAKLLACRAAGRGGVERVEIVDGRRASAFELGRTDRPGGTKVTAGRAAQRGRRKGSR